MCKHLWPDSNVRYLHEYKKIILKCFFLPILTCNWYSKTGISSASLGPNCLLVAEKRMATIRASFRLTRPILVMDTLPPDREPRDAPKRLFGSCRTRKTQRYMGKQHNNLKIINREVERKKTEFQQGISLFPTAEQQTVHIQACQE